MGKIILSNGNSYEGEFSEDIINGYVNIKKNKKFFRENLFGLKVKYMKVIG